MRKVIVAALAVVYIVFGCPAYLADPGTAPWVKAVSYHLFHANIFHLAVNCLSIWVVFRKPDPRNLITALAIATLAYFTATRPVVGFSNILFAMIGLRTPAFRSPWWKQRNTLVFFLVTAGMLFFPQFSAVTHITSLLAGIMIAAYRRRVKELDDDYRHASR